MRFRDAEDREAFGDVGFGPIGRLRLGLGVGLDEACQAGLGVCPVVGIEDGGDVGGDFAFEVLLGDVLQRVLLEMELPALPWGCTEAGLECGFEAGVGFRGGELGNADTTLSEAV